MEEHLIRSLADKLIPLEKAQEIVLAHTDRLPVEEVDFQDASGRVLAEDITSDIDLPPFPRSAMDGYALRSEDAGTVPTRLDVIGAIPAGTYPSFRVESGTAAQIMTGAPVPEGADAVQIVEQTRVVGEGIPDFGACPTGSKCRSSWKRGQNGRCGFKKRDPSRSGRGRGGSHGRPNPVEGGAKAENRCHCHRG